MSNLFDQADASSIESFGQKLLKSTLRTKRGEFEVPQELLDVIPGQKSRGSFGGIVEKYYYGINPGNESRPDFLEAKVELKTTPLKKLVNGEYAAKERLVLNIINYVNEADRTFETSSFYTKNNLIMLLGYLYQKGVALGDLEVMVASLLDFNKLTELDRKIIREDWAKINQKIREGKAHELSEGDTLYLGACTKSSDSTARTGQYGTNITAKPRAYTFKGGYMTKLLREFIAKHEEENLDEKLDTKSELTFEEQILQRLSKFYGKTNLEIEDEIGTLGNVKAKGYVQNLVRKILGISGTSVPEFDAAEISIKTIQVNAKGNMKESMSFPAFTYGDLLEQSWDADEEAGEIKADFQRNIERRFLFVVFQYEKSPREESKKFLKAFFWTMPYEDRLEVKNLWDETIRRVQASNPKLPSSKENPVGHIRPHGRNAEDRDVLPDGTTTTKQGFWLNMRYIKNVVSNN